MVQTYILSDVMDPLAASKSGADKSICGDCAFRGETNEDPKRKIAKSRRCYVNLGQGPLIVWKHLQRNGYRDLSEASFENFDAISEIGSGRVVRQGTYGDPAAVPVHVWANLLRDAKSWTGYSHQWRNTDFRSGTDGPKFLPFYQMASADDLIDAEDAWSCGFRTFRVVANVDDIVQGKEILCPASKEAGFRTTCADCKLCGGLSTGKSVKSIAIVEH